jgi:hypothetical protein
MVIFEFNVGFCAMHFTGRIHTVETLGYHRDDGMFTDASHAHTESIFRVEEQL